MQRLGCARTFCRVYRLTRTICGGGEFEFDADYLCDPRNFDAIAENIKIRKGVGDINKVIDLHRKLERERREGNAESIKSIGEKLAKEAKKIPNRTHPAVKSYGDQPFTVRHINEPPQFAELKPYDFADIGKMLNVTRTSQLGPLTGHRSYYFMSELAQLEEALIKYALGNLLRRGFSLVSVPDILPRSLIESCGMIVNGERTQIYSLDASHHNPELCLSGTAEMSLAGLLANTVQKKEVLPLKLAAVSRCYRAETSNLIEQRGIYRVHQFTKVEMFGVTTPDDSERMLEEFRTIEEESFAELGLHLRVLDMPPHELGAPAYRKYDIEAWMPGRKMFGEISSCSNCTDYQSRRLSIKYLDESSNHRFSHTLNGTACAIPRMLIALFETYQRSDGKILIPKPLREFMDDKEYITRTSKVPALKLSKIKARS